jgi:predicted nucleotidyltransferase
MQLDKFNILINNNDVVSPHTALCKYAGFNINRLLENKNAIIFGGALRDIAADESDLISDIDIICDKLCIETIKSVLLKQCYVQYNLYKRSLIDLQTENIIELPLTFIKDKKIIQLIQISDYWSYKEKHESKPAIDKLLSFVSQVDLSCCGLAYHPYMQCKSVIENAFEACVTKTIFTMPKGDLYDCVRASARIEKLTKRGWELGDVVKITNDDIDSLFSPNEQPFEEDLPF